MLPAKKVLIIFTHPQQQSFNYSLMNKLCEGLKSQNAEIIIEDLYARHFSPLLYDLRENDKDPLTIAMQDHVRWADLLIFIQPVWWANIPAMLKGYLDRVFTQGFVFKYNWLGIPVGLMQKKEAFILSTCDTPVFILRLTAGDLGIKAFKKGVLEFCRFRRVRSKIIGSLHFSSLKRRKRWLNQVEKLGGKLGKQYRRKRTGHFNYRGQQGN